ncbi:hypothetical protein V8F20_010715 [Naviculisporaceae sp. PSN 640]
MSSSSSTSTPPTSVAPSIAPGLNRYNDPLNRPSQALDPVLGPPVRFFTKTYHRDTYDAINPRNFNLSGKSVLITGASKGIGRTTAIRFALAGCSRIAIAARSSSLLSTLTTEIHSAATSAGHPPPQVLELALDVTSPSSVEAAAKTLAAEFNNSLDVLIPNAAAAYDWTPNLADSDVPNWLNCLSVSLNGTYLVARYFLPLVLNSTLKIFIGLSSVGALTLTPGSSGYQVAKIGVMKLVEFIDQEYWRQGVIAVSIHPGGVDTDLSRSLPEEFYGFLEDSPELAGDWMVWLAASGRKEWLAGRYVWVNWDVEELEQRKEEIVEGNLLKLRLAV